MRTVTKTAIANLKQNKSRNILIGIAIFLTALLLVLVPNVGFATMNLEFEGVSQTLPTFHVMYREVGKRKRRC